MQLVSILRSTSFFFGLEFRGKCEIPKSAVSTNYLMEFYSKWHIFGLKLTKQVMGEYVILKYYTEHKFHLITFDV